MKHKNIIIPITVAFLGTFTVSVSIDFNELFSTSPPESEWELMTKYKGTKIGQISKACNQIPFEVRMRSYWKEKTFVATLRVTSTEGCNTNLTIFNGTWTSKDINCEGNFRVVLSKKDVSRIVTWPKQTKECLQTETSELNLYSSTLIF